MLAYPPRKCILIPNGIAELPPGTCNKGSPPTLSHLIKVLYVGRFDHVKGFDTFIEAMRRLNGYAEGCVVGAHLTERGKSLIIPDNVIVNGWRARNELGSFYQENDLLVVPSRAEAFGLVALEAMRSGLPRIL